MDPTLLIFFLKKKKGGGGGGGSDFSHKNGGVGKIGEAVLKKERVYHLFSYQYENK